MVNIAEALSPIRNVGTVDSSGDNLRRKIPDRERRALQPAIDTLRTNKAEALALATEIEERSTSLPWAEWKAAYLNRLFQEQGVTKLPGRITAATVRHGERAKG